MPTGELVESLLADLGTIAGIARAGVLSLREERLEAGETRPAAVLYLDVAGFTSLSRALSAEQLALLIDRSFRIFELTVRAHGGYCDKVIGDAALYVFAGHPAHPPVCESALRAALKLGERVAQVNESLRETTLRLAIRAGVGFGEVTRQQVGGAGQQVTVMGETVNVAQRLEAAAQPGTVQTTIRVLEQAGDIFKRTALGTQELKGIGPVALYAVTGVEEAPVRLRGAFGKLTPLAGREALLAQALEQIEKWLGVSYPPESWDIAQMTAPLAGRNRLLLLRGVAAVGKSRLAYEIVERLRSWSAGVPARDSGSTGFQPVSRGDGGQDEDSRQDACPTVATATAHCTESASLRAFTAELARVAGLSAANLPERWEALCGNAARVVSPEYGERQRQHLRLLAYVLGCQAIDASAIGQADPQSFATGCQLAIRACCELAAHEAGSIDFGSTGFQPVSAELDGQGKDGRQGEDSRQDACPTKTPVILVVEDLQWLGGLRNILADVLARACLPCPLVVICTARPEYAPGAEELRELVGAKPCFAQDATPREVVGEPLVAPAAEPGAPAGRTSAAPTPSMYRIIELGALTREEGGTIVEALLPGLKLPSAVAAELHEKAAGIPYFYEDFARMLVRRGLVVADGSTGFGSTGFQPVSSKDSGQEKDSRQDACPTATWRLAADVSALDIPENIQALLLGRLDQLEQPLKALALRASVLGRSFEPGLLAALEARLGYAHAGRLVQELDALVEQRVLARARAEEGEGPGAEGPGPRAEGQGAAGPAGGISAGGAGAAFAGAAAAAGGAVAVGGAEVRPASLAGETYFFEHLLTREAAYGALLQRNRRLLHSTAADVLAGMIVPGTLSEQQLLPKMILHLGAAGRHREQYNACSGLLLVLALSGQLERWEQWEQVAQGALDQASQGAETAARCSSAWLRAYAVRDWQLGNAEAARELYERALTCSREEGNLLAEAKALSGLANLKSSAGALDEALEYNRTALKLAREAGDRHTESSLIGNTGILLHQQGRTEAALELFAQALSISRELGHLSSEALCQIHIGTVHDQAGCRGKAEACFAEALRLARLCGNRSVESVALGNLGVALRGLGQADSALGYCEEALKLDRAMGRTEGVAYNLLNMGELAAELGHLEQASKYCEEALGLFANVGDALEMCLAGGMLGKALAGLGRLDEARSALSEAQQLAERLGGKRSLALTACCWVHYWKAAGELARAADCLKLAQELVLEVGADEDVRLSNELAAACDAFGA
jgi:class 3 adenylate cyclase/tetratricopeptide (TPR) repeat protein